MIATPLRIPEVVLLEPKVHGDERGFFFESWNKRTLESLLNRELNFVQDNHSLSAKNVLRGLHYQIKQPQGKLVRVIQGQIFDVAVDLRRSSQTFGHWVGEILSSANKRQLWVPEGFAHGFLVLSDTAEVLYKATDYYAPESEKILLWRDTDLGIVWPTGPIPPTLSSKDTKGLPLHQASFFT
jgi:dTDP-4-dehydrorhamnose 3,5-epimerase